MMNRTGTLRYLVILLVLFAGTGINTFAQEVVDYDELLQRVDTIENPVYKPVVSVGYGVLNFFGDVRNSSRLPVIGNPAFRVNVTTYIDNNRYFAANFYFLGGTLTGEQRSVSDLSRNLNFSSGIYSVGLSARYEFGHLIPAEMRFRPYMGIGLEQLNFNTKGDLFNSRGEKYFYWPDGSIRNLSDNEPGAALPLVRDYVYETDLRSWERSQYGLGDYNPRSLAVPLEIGFTMKVSQRVFFSLGTAYHYTFTDFIDNVAYEGTNIQGNRGNDAFMFTHATLHFDMFSDPATRTVELLFADVELDPIFFEDEDGDFVLDFADQCPGTPYGVEVDSVGCPLDSDNDGVPDYLDKEPDTPEGTWVDKNGVTVTEDDFLVSLHRDAALKREDLDAYMEMLESKYRGRSVVEIPEKFMQIDTDGDGYISFEELLWVIDDYFDFEVDLTLEELRQVNEFFFSQ
jgi:hypothetical protein